MTIKQARPTHRKFFEALLVAVLVVSYPVMAAAQVVPVPPPGSTATITRPSFEPPFHLTIRVYVYDSEGRRLFVPGQGVDLRLSDASGRRIGRDPVSGAFVSDMPKASYTPVTNPQPNAPVGPRGLVGTGIRLDEPADGHYLLEVIGPDRVSFDVAVEEWDRTESQWADRW